MNKLKLYFKKSVTALIIYFFILAVGIYSLISNFTTGLIIFWGVVGIIVFILIVKWFTRKYDTTTAKVEKYEVLE